MECKQEIKEITQLLMENLKLHEAETQSYSKGFADATAEAIYLIEKNFLKCNTLHVSKQYNKSNSF